MWVIVFFEPVLVNSALMRLQVLTNVVDSVVWRSTWRDPMQQAVEGRLELGDFELQSGNVLSEDKT